jgi:hypothetical protein
MPQHDMVIDNGSGLGVRTDFNAAMQALVSLSSGPVEPTVKYAGMFWLDLSVSPDGLLRQRNQANTAWVDPVIPQTSIVRTLFTTSGTYTKPAGLKFLDVEIMSPGGGGGGCGGTAAGNYSAAGGGGSGAWGRQLFDAASLPTSVAYVVGASGAGGAASAAGGAGGTSSFSTLSVTGGGGGAGSTQGTVGAAGGGAGGVVTGGEIAATGGLGGFSYFVVASTFVFSGHGANSPFGQSGGAVVGGAAAGINASGFGAGGSGATNTASQASPRGGGGGAPGFIRITEYF